MPHNLLLTGRPGIGKTTVIRRVLERLPPIRLGGFTTAEIRGPHGRLGFRATALGGPEIVLAHVEQAGPYRVGAYGVDIATFERVILPFLDPRREDVELFVVDEIGKMECFSALFQARVRQLLDDPRPVLGSVALRGPALIEEVHRRPDVERVEVTPSNRAGLPEVIAARLQRWLRGME